MRQPKSMKMGLALAAAVVAAGGAIPAYAVTASKGDDVPAVSTPKEEVPVEPAEAEIVIRSWSVDIEGSSQYDVKPEDLLTDMAAVRKTEPDSVLSVDADGNVTVEKGDVVATDGPITADELEALGGPKAASGGRFGLGSRLSLDSGPDPASVCWPNGYEAHSVEVSKSVHNGLGIKVADLIATKTWTDDCYQVENVVYKMDADRTAYGSAAGWAYGGAEPLVNFWFKYGWTDPGDGDPNGFQYPHGAQLSSLQGYMCDTNFWGSGTCVGDFQSPQAWIQTTAYSDDGVCWRRRSKVNDQPPGDNWEAEQTGCFYELVG